MAPSLPLNPTSANPVIFLSTTALPHHLTSNLRRELPDTIFLERDLTNFDDTVGAEGDIILSPNRCILLFTMAQMTQALPSLASRRTLLVASKYRLVEILVPCPTHSKGRDMAFFSGWVEQLRRTYDIRVILSRSEEELLRWALWLCLQREFDGPLAETEYLTEDVSEVHQ